MNRKKGEFKLPLPASPHTTTMTDEKIAAWYGQGRAEATSAPSAAPVAAPTSVSSHAETGSRQGPGRPALTEETRRTIVALRAEDVQQLEELCLRWKRERGGTGSVVKVTAVMRSLLAVLLPQLERMEGICDEGELREQLIALIKE